MTRSARVALFAVLALGLAGSSRAEFLQYSAILDGAGETPPTGSPGTGSALVSIDTLANTMRVQVSFSGLTGATTASHIHAATASPGTGTAGVATTLPTFPGFPLGVTSGTYDQTFDMTLASSYNSNFITANGGTPATAEAALFADIAADKAYLNIHTRAFPGGEISGFLTAVPEPSGVVLMSLGAVGACICLRRRAALSRG